MLRIITFTTLLIGIASTCFSSESSVDSTAFISDLDTLKVWVEKHHPLPFARCAQEDWTRAYENAKAKVKTERTEIAFVEAVGELLSVLKDSHTSISIEPWRKDVLNGYRAHSLQFTSIENLVYVKRDGLGQIKTGTRVDSINGVASEDLLSKALLIAPQEGNSWTGKTRFAEALLVPVAVSLQDENLGDTFQGGFQVNGVNYELGLKKKKASWKSMFNHEKHIEWNVGEDHVTLKIKSFGKGKSKVYFSVLRRGFRKLERKSKKWGTKALVIDLRGNTGGYSARMSEVLYYICDKTIKVPAIYIKPNDLQKGSPLDTVRFEGRKMGGKHLWEGPTSLLIDGFSASASVSLAGVFRQQKLGPIFGEACLGTRSGTFSDPVSYTLPESGLKVSIASGIFSMDDEIKMGMRSVAPTRWVQCNVKDLISGNDPTEGAIKDWISNPEVGDESLLIDRESKMLWKELETVYSRVRDWGGKTRNEAWEILLEGDQCISELKNLRKNATLEALKQITKDLKQCLTRRNTSIQIVLPLKMRTVFQELTSPNRPAVLHFGLHNRADCNVCKPSNQSK